LSGTVTAGQRLTSALLGQPGWTAMTLINSWSNAGSGLVQAQYRFWALANELEVIGCLSHASISGTSQFCSTFTGNLPSSSQHGVGLVTGGTSVGSSFVLLYNPTGVMELLAIPAGTTQVDFHASFPLDA
jgi:hypothetical protein